MVYIRAKKVKSDVYLYLVKSIWDSKQNTSKQEIVKYLGKASKITQDDIPLQYRSDPKILSTLSSYSPADIKKNERITKRSKNEIYQRLTEGSIQDCLKVYETYIKTFVATDFFDKVLRPVMKKIGQDWADGKIGIATEHVASNVAQTLIKIIMSRISSKGNKKKILICVPVGEEHHLGCDVLETYLTTRGYRVYNMGTSIPTKAIIDFIRDKDPDVIFVSITLPDNLVAGQRLIKKIDRAYDKPILVGGYALQTKDTPKFAARIVRDVNLDEIPRILRTV